MTASGSALWSKPTNLMLNKSLIHILTSTIRLPAAVPWPALPPTSRATLLEVSHTAEPMKKVAMAPSSTGFLPQISDSFADTGAAAALASKYADPIQIYPAAECRSLAIVGIPVVAIEKPRASRKRVSWLVSLLVRTRGHEYKAWAPDEEGCQSRCQSHVAELFHLWLVRESYHCVYHSFV